MENQDSQTPSWHYTDFDDSDFQIHGRNLFFVVVVVCIIIFVTIVYLYARWVCRISPLTSPPHAPPQQTTPPRPPPPPGLDPNAIRNLPINLYRASANSKETECAICLGFFHEGQKVTLLPDCRHCYHSECVDEWLRTQSSCPLCRASLRVDSPV